LDGMPRLPKYWLCEGNAVWVVVFIGILMWGKWDSN